MERYVYDSSCYREMMSRWSFISVGMRLHASSTTWWMVNARYLPGPSTRLALSCEKVNHGTDCFVLAGRDHPASGRPEQSRSWNCS